MGLLQLIQRAFSRRQQSGIIPFSGAIPEYRKKLLFISKEIPEHSDFGISIGISVDENGEFEPMINEADDPSTIYLVLPVSDTISPASSVPKMGYFPSYTKMTPEQRLVYLNWLRDISAPIDIGYVFVFYYGLERHLVYGDIDTAVEEILLLRKQHHNSSFYSYSAAALVHACLLRQRIDILRHLYFDLNFDYFGNSVLLILHHQNLDLQPEMLVKLAMKLNGVNKRYIKEKCPMYQIALLDELHERFNKESYPFSENYRLDDVAGIPYPIFANISFPLEIRTPPRPQNLWVDL